MEVYLSDQQKLHNKHLSQMRVVVENTISRVKRWKIIKGVFRQWRNGKGQIDFDDIMTVITSLTNRKIKESPPRKADWVTPEWMHFKQLT